jgi:SPP1 gp7 family putative phage head morphogenesis protein
MKMVDVSVFNDQLDEVKKLHTLPKETEKAITRLLKNASFITEKQSKILQSIFDNAIRGFDAKLSLEQLQILSTINIFGTPTAIEKLLPYQQNIAKMFQFGIQFTNKTPSRTVLQLEQSVTQSSMQYITKLGDTLKQQTGQIIADGIRKGKMPNDISNNVKAYLNNQKWQADRIVRTETMRAAHMGSYSQARRDGKKYFVIDGRAEFCIYCKSIAEKGPFEIDETRFMPPFHPNCACLPVYYDSLDEANDDHDYLQSQIEKQRKVLEKEGYTIKDDGTGSYKKGENPRDATPAVNKKPPEERIKN